MNYPIIRNAHSGYVRPDGNPMTGGHYWSHSHLCYNRVDFDNEDIFPPELGEWLMENYQDYTNILAYLIFCRDESTGYDGAEMDELMYCDEEFLDWLEKSPVSDEVKDDVLSKLDKYAESLYTDDFTPFEP